MMSDVLDAHTATTEGPIGKIFSPKVLDYYLVVPFRDLKSIGRHRFWTFDVPPLIKFLKKSPKKDVRVPSLGNFSIILFCSNIDFIRLIIII